MTIAETATCLEASYETRKEIDRLCTAIVRESSLYRELARLVREAGDNTGLDDENRALIKAAVQELVELCAEWGLS